MNQIQEQLQSKDAVQVPKNKWQASPASLQRLLHWLDGEQDSQGERYEIMRQRLLNYFDRKNCVQPDILTDETLHRVMRWLEEQNKSFDEEPAKVCFNTARFVFHEYLRQTARTPVSLADLSAAQEPAIPASVPHNDERLARELQLNCLDECTAKLAVDDRLLIVQYYYGEQRSKLDNRKALAAARNLSANALAIKACRIRDRLRACVQTCTSKNKR